MKIAPITHTEIVVIGGVLVAGFLAWKAYKTVKNVSVSQVVETAANTVDVRTTAPDSALGASQSWFADTVEKGQRAGASTFVTSFFTGLTK